VKLDFNNLHFTDSQFYSAMACIAVIVVIFWVFDITNTKLPEEGGK
jgi:hypothetical protein